jgi:hypothetical protein
MQAFANHGCGYHALQGFAQMVRHGYKPSSQAGLVEKGRNMFKSIQRVYDSY